MATPDACEEALCAAIESGKLDGPLADDPEVAEVFAAHQKLESLFGLLRQPETMVAQETVLSQPTQIGRFLIRRVLGQGAFGTVYLADDPELRRQVAIKVSRPDRFSSADDAERFLEEARSAAGLKHSGIVTVHDVGRENSLCWIVLECIKGRTLEAQIAAERLPPVRAAEIVAEVADALHHAHKRGFFHRDLKPGNILLDGQGKPHVADFGLAVSEESQRLQAGQVAGTPAYMSPEQVRGETDRLDGRTDIWSLGVIFYELLTGRQPFWRGDVQECFDGVLNRDPKPPRQIDDTVPAEYERICLKALSKNPTDRYTTARDMAFELRHALSPKTLRLPVIIVSALCAVFVVAATVGGWLLRGHDGRSRNEKSEVTRGKGGDVTIEASTEREALPHKLKQPGLAATPLDADQAKHHQQAWADYLGMPVHITNSLGMKLTLIRPGEFRIGSTQEEVDQIIREANGGWVIGRVPHECPQRRVKISQPFYLGIYEVKESEYEALMGTNPSQAEGGADDAPVETVSWADAVDFCRRLTELPKERASGRVYRLPSEAEWEYACRAGTAGRYCFGSDKASLGEYAWFDCDPKHPVGQKRPNAWGLYDMHGNVWEWCADWHRMDYYKFIPTKDPKGPDFGTARVFRGGSYGNGAAEARCAFRHYGEPGMRDPCIGFRAAMTVDP